MNEQTDIEDSAPAKPNGQSISKRAMAVGKNRHEAELATYSEESPESNNILEAAYEIQAELDVTVATDKDGAFKKKNGGMTRYASLPQLLRFTKPVIMKQKCLLRMGAGRTWVREQKSGTQMALEVYTRIIHVPSKEWMAEWMEIPYTKQDANGAMSALKYGKRGTLRSILAIDDDEADDDGRGTLAPKLGKVEIHPEALSPIAAMNTNDEPQDLIDWGEKNASILNDMDPVAVAQCNAAYDQLLADLQSKGKK